MIIFNSQVKLPIIQMYIIYILYIHDYIYIQYNYSHYWRFTNNDTSIKYLVEPETMGLSMVLVLKRKTAVPNAVRNWRCFSPGSEPKKNGVGVICGYIHIIYIWTHIFLLIPYHSKLSVYMYVFVNVYILYFLAIH